MILLYDAGGHLLEALHRTPTVPVAPVQMLPVTSTPAGDVVLQSDLINAAATARGAYLANHGTFDDVTWDEMDAQPGNHLSFTGVTSLTGPQRSISFDAAGAVANLAVTGNDDNICWFARIDMQVNGGASPGGTQFVGMKTTADGCWGGAAPATGWADGFPPES
jgi:hypothetical protein